MITLFYKGNPNLYIVTDELDYVSRMIETEWLKSRKGNTSWPVLEWWENYELVPLLCLRSISNVR